MRSNPAHSIEMDSFPVDKWRIQDWKGGVHFVKFRYNLDKGFSCIFQKTKGADRWVLIYLPISKHKTIGNEA